jgi:Tfp pilus assembly protein FimT
MYHEPKQRDHGAMRVGLADGITFPEFMVAGTIAAILVAIVGLSFVDVIAAQRLQ